MDSSAFIYSSIDWLPFQETWLFCNEEWNPSDTAARQWQKEGMNQYISQRLFDTWREYQTFAIPSSGVVLTSIFPTRWRPNPFHCRSFRECLLEILSHLVQQQSEVSSLPATWSKRPHLSICVLPCFPIGRTSIDNGRLKWFPSKCTLFWHFHKMSGSTRRERWYKINLKSYKTYSKNIQNLLKDLYLKNKTGSN